MVPVGREMPFVPSMHAVVGAGAARMSRDTSMVLGGFLFNPSRHSRK